MATLKVGMKIQDLTQRGTPLDTIYVVDRVRRVASPAGPQVHIEVSTLRQQAYGVTGVTRWDLTTIQARFAAGTMREDV
jgi:hypothetical protein